MSARRADDDQLHVVILSWRDSTHPEGGGAEQYAEHVAAGLAADGHDVQIWCARHPGAPAVTRRNGVVLRHAGGRLTVYLAALLRLLGHRLSGRGPDVVVDVHNGVPFFARLVAGCPVVVLVHHVHREQWSVVFGPLAARIGWWIESWLSPRVHRGCQYVTVSDVTRDELVVLGVDRHAVAVVHNGTVAPLLSDVPRAPEPHLVVLGRLVPHKRVEHAVRALRTLRDEGLPVRLTVIGDGWWSQEVEAEVGRCDVRSAVDLVGYVTEQRKHELLAASWVMLAPSLKEGWGLMVVEAATHEVPAVAYADAGGVSESIVDGSTGLLVRSEDDLVAACRRLITDHDLRASLGRRAAEHAGEFTWRASTTAFLQVLLTAVRHGDTVDLVDGRPRRPAARRRRPLSSRTGPAAR